MVSLPIGHNTRRRVVVRHNPDTAALVAYVTECGKTNAETIRHIRTAKQLKEYLEEATGNGKDD